MLFSSFIANFYDFLFEIMKFIVIFGIPIAIIVVGFVFLIKIFFLPAVSIQPVGKNHGFLFRQRKKDGITLHHLRHRLHQMPRFSFCLTSGLWSRRAFS